MEPQVDEIYLDNNATTRMLPDVCEAIGLVARSSASNASSAQSSGDLNRTVLRQARADVARLAGCEPENLFFTSGGTEANNWVLRNAIKLVGSQRCRIITTPVEHSSVLRSCEAIKEDGAIVEYVPVDDTGTVDVVALAKLLEDVTALVSVQWVNNETGVIQPIEEIAKACQDRGVLFHTDAAQAIGKLEVDLGTTPVDFLTLSAHKWHGPSGVGAMYARTPRLLQPLLYGGDQEQGIRAGTENILGLAGAGRAARIRADHFSEDCTHMFKLRDRFERALAEEIPSICVNGQLAKRVCNTSNIRFSGIDGQAMLAQLDCRGVYCSQGSACESMRPEPSHVLRAMGLSEQEAYSSIRFSFSPLNTIAEVHQAVKAIAEAYGFLQGDFEPQPVGTGLVGDE